MNRPDKRSETGREPRTETVGSLAEARAGSSSAESEVNRFLGGRVLRRRRELGLTQAEVGRAIGVGFQQIHKYETGGSRITPGRLLRLASALGVSVNYFFEGLPGWPHRPRENRA